VPDPVWGLSLEANLEFAIFPATAFTFGVTYDSLMPTGDFIRSHGKAQEAFHLSAAKIAAEQFGREVFLRGVVEVSNFCRENCAYCGMRRDNRSLARFRANHDQLAELIVHHRPSSITDINIQSGEDPVVVREVVLPLIKTIKRETPLGVSVCLGTLDESLYRELKNAGAGIYIIKFEIADPALYAKMTAPGSYKERIEHIRLLAASGWKVSSGFIAGLPNQSDEELLSNFTLAQALPLDGCSVSPFIPGDETPLSKSPGAGIDLTLNCMAALRLSRPDWVIPAVSALNIAEPGSGYRRGLRTGANLVTINMTPSDVRGDYLLYKRDRFIMTEERILNAISAEGLKPSRQGLSAHYKAIAAVSSGAGYKPIATAA
jgi:biotin synthase